MKKLLWVAMTAVGLSSTAIADVNLKHFNDLIQGVTIEKTQPSEIEGLYEVFVKETPYPIFISKDGRYMLEGNAVDLVRGINLSETYINSHIKEKMDQVNEKDMVIYKAPKEEQVVTVFTTTDCPFCRMLHSQLDEYLAEGITVRYLAFPYRGLNSQGYEDMVSVWCSDNRNEALNQAVTFAEAKKGQQIPAKSCNNPVADQYKLALELGVQGTPAIILEDGSMIPGYVPAKELKKRIEMKGL